MQNVDLKHPFLTRLVCTVKKNEPHITNIIQKNKATFLYQSELKHAELYLPRISILGGFFEHHDQ